MRHALQIAIVYLLCLFVVISSSTHVMADDQARDAIPENPYPGAFPAPSLEGGTEWLNASGPVSLRDLRGKIVLLDFWTYCCINCIHVLPDLKYLEEKYPDQLVVIGVHAAKFDNEKESQNIREAILRYEISHPVVNDSNMTIARKYAFNSWPTFILIDPEGKFVGRQSGEGNRELFDKVIGQMIAYHRIKGTLDETPLRFDLERFQEPTRPLRYPGKVLADESGNRLFISDSNHNRIVITDLAGQLLDVVGSGQIGSNDGSYAECSFDHPQGMVLVDGTLYVADTENHLIRTIDLNSKQVSTLAGTGVQARFRAQGGTLKETALNSPWALEHLDGVLYIAMAGPHQLWKHELGRDLISPFAGSGREDITDGPLSRAALAQPSGITTDGTNLYHVDSEGSAVRKVTLGRDGQVTTIVGPRDLPQGASLFEFGDIDGVGANVRLQHPLGIVFHKGKLIITDTYNDKIKLIDIETQSSTTWLGTGTAGTGLDPVQLTEPAGLSIANDSLYIADTNNHRILVTNIATKETKELVIAGLNPPDPPKTIVEPIDLAGSTQLEPTAVHGPEATVTVKFDLPTGFKLNELAPVGYRVSVTDGDESVIAGDSLGKRLRAEKGDGQATLTIPLAKTSGEVTVALALSYQYCRDGVGAVCKFGSQTWTIPLKVGGTESSAISLNAKPE